MRHQTPAITDENSFLQDWLERRYGCGFAQKVVDDLMGVEPDMYAPYDSSAVLPANDNLKTTLRHSA